MRESGTTPTRPELEDQRGFLLQSIRDLDVERAAGDLSEEDHRLLRDRYTARAAAVLRAMAPEAASPASEAAPTPAPGRPKRRRRRAFAWAASAAFAAAAVVLVVAEVSSRLPGQTATGSVSLGSAETLERTLAQAQALETAGKASQALALYRRVLQADPTQEQALAEAGWLEFEAGVSAKSSELLTEGQRQEQSAEQADPNAYAPHLYLGSMLLVEARPAQAADEFAAFLGARPPVAVVQRAWPFVVRAYAGAGRSAPTPPAGVQG